MFHVNKNHYILWIIASTLITFGVVSYLSMASQINWKEPVLKHSYTFDDGTAKDVVGEAHGIIKGNCEILNGLFITDEEGDYIELPADKININEYSAISLEAYVIAGKANETHTMLSYFGNKSNEVGVDYIFQTLINNETCGTSISCKNYEVPWETHNNVGGQAIQDDRFHHIVTTFDNHELKFYIDGKLVHSPIDNEDNIIENLSNKFAYLCKSGYMQDQTWLGAIDTFNIYEGILDEKTIAKSAKRLEEHEKKLDKFLVNNYKTQIAKPELRHSYTFDNGTANDIIGGAHGTILGDGKIENGMFVANEQGEYIELPAPKISINAFSAITLEAVVKSDIGGCFSYFGCISGSRAINYISQWTYKSEWSGTGITCIRKIYQPWEALTIAGGHSVLENRFHHFVTTFDNKVLKYYIDGELVDVQLNLRQKTNNISNIHNELAYLCKSANKWEQTWLGEIDTFNIYQGILDAKTIAKSAEEYLKEKEL
ncbi:LamG-like jellyroll fold domain-containing protein [Flavobacteriaceae bacterium SZ-1-7]|uniref:LamG-like jellyroll fold domain-containing protein n=1 Tax=Tamlana sedimenti TaxID=3134126 RepID=UPI0031276252